MSENDIKVLRNGGEAREYQTNDYTTAGNRSATIKAGEPVETKNSYFVDVVATADPQAGTDELIGVSEGISSDTSAADGHVMVRTIIPGQTVLRGNATTSTNVNTQAKINALLYTFVAFDVAGTPGAITIDENQGGTLGTEGLKIINADPDAYTVDVVVNARACEAGYDASL